MACIALVPRRHAYRGVKAVSRLLECDVEVVAQISAAVDLRATALPTAATTTKDVAKNVTKGIRETTAKPGTRSARTAHIRVNSGVAKAVISFALLRIRQHLVGFFCLFEFIFRLLAIRIAIRMEFHGELAIGLFDFFVRSVLRYTERFVKIAFCHG